jgi:hypothetical protein
MSCSTRQQHRLAVAIDTQCTYLAACEHTISSDELCKASGAAPNTKIKGLCCYQCNPVRWP